MRRSLGRLTAAGLAIVIGTAFVAATLIAGGVITRTSYDAVSASYADADLVATSEGGLTAADLATLRDTPGVEALDGRRSLRVELVSGPQRAVPEVAAVASDPRLEAQELVSGAFPTAVGEVAVPGPMAERLGVGVGDPLTASRQVWTPDAAQDPATGTDPEEPAGTWTNVPEELTVVGLLSDPAGAFAESGGAVLVVADDADRWAAQDATGSVVGSSGDVATATFTRAVIALTDGADVGQVTAALEATAPEGTTIRTKDDEAAAKVSELTNGSDILTTIVLGFAAIALLVAALVISNTFQVLIAQRTRALALLRCVGADKRQLRRSVLQEAGLLGLASSALGLALGVGLAQVTLSVLGRMNSGVPLPPTVSITSAVVLAPLVVGTLVTVMAALAPARAATKVAPLAALRPADAPTLAHRRSLPRLVLAVLLTVVGAALLGLAVVVGQSSDAFLALGIGVLGGILSFVGVLVGAVFWVPRVVGAAGRLLATRSMAAKLAAANTVRNPRRTAATSAALLIGVTLVAMMSTGAASTRTTLDGALDDQFPVDVAISRDAPAVAADGTTSDPVTPALVATVADVPGVIETVALRDLFVQLEFGGATEWTDAFAIDPAAAGAVLRAPSMMAGLDDSTAVLSSGIAERLGISAGDRVTLTPELVGPDGVTAATGEPVELTAVLTDLPGGVAFTPGALARTGADLPTNQVWARLADSNDASTVVPAIEDALSETAVQIAGAAVERAMFQRIIDTLLAVVVGLLGVAVVIALIGVANTLSLSVLERRRESATLRAIGLSRRQLRAMLAIEGMLIAGVGAVIGAVLGTLYGWAGVATLVGSMGEVRLDVPWGQLGLVVLVALVAGLLASVIPGRAAARTSPVAALAVD
ncbi:ABC transporter permease [Pengzhenrongella frigida]|nr:FtsX-like permease family protein [Cellulomonas sp. HLT2-17]